jgi:Arc/MetJ-type ribon-helix-helix transcriptional regulator
MDAGMKKITVEVPEHDLAMAQDLTGAGVTETVRVALKKLASIQAQQRLLKLRGQVKFDLTLEEMRYDRE